MASKPDIMMTAPDYQTLIDTPTWAFIRETEAAYPPDTARLTIVDQRRIYDDMCQKFHAGSPQGVTARNAPMGGVACRHYTRIGSDNPVPQVLFFHGGGFVVGGLESHDDICAEICAATGMTVHAVDYRLCPEYPHPAAFQDCLSVARSTRGPILLVGDSAGGALAACVARALCDPRVLGQVLIYPVLGGRGDSYRHHAKAPMLTGDDVDFYAKMRRADLDDPTAYALGAQDYTGLPPTFAIAAECDPLASDASLYADRITAAGGRAVAITEPGLVHGFLRARHTVPRARASFARVTSTLSAFARHEWPFGDTP
ncbi:MAG: alpha/beta hydrolase [Paracoccaceae bacterium]